MYIYPKIVIDPINIKWQITEKNPQIFTSFWLKGMNNMVTIKEDVHFMIYISILIFRL